MNFVVQKKSGFFHASVIQVAVLFVTLVVVVLIGIGLDDQFGNVIDDRFVQAAKVQGTVNFIKHGVAWMFGLSLLSASITFSITQEEKHLGRKLLYVILLVIGLTIFGIDAGKAISIAGKEPTVSKQKVVSTELSSIFISGRRRGFGRRRDSIKYKLTFENGAKFQVRTQGLMNDPLGWDYYVIQCGDTVVQICDTKYYKLKA